jgi:hypothetical protein
MHYTYEQSGLKRILFENGKPYPLSLMFLVPLDAGERPFLEE